MRFPLTLAVLVAVLGLAHSGEERTKTTPVRTVAFSQDGKYLVAVSWRNAEAVEIGYATVWEMPAGKLVFNRREPKGIPTAAFSVDSSLLALGSFTDDAIIVDTATWKVQRTLPGHGKAARSVAFSQDGKTLVVSSSDGFIHLWDTANWTVQKKIDSAHTGRVYVVALTKDGKTLASGGEDGLAKLWELPAGKELHSFSHRSLVRRVTFASEDRHLVYTSWDGTINIRDRKTGKELAKFESGGSLDDVAVSSDGTRLASNTGVGQIIRLNLKGADDAALQSLRQLMKGWDDDRIAVRDKASKEIASLGFPALDELRKIAKEAASPEIRLRARMAQAGIRNPEPIFKMAHAEGNVECVAFSPDGRMLATGGAEGTVRLWNTATGEEIRVLRQFAAPPPAAAKVPRSEY